ncbi:L,D-transpeptidase [Kordiimonas sp. SCSIO 12610]|uniref:L,D-transpeptidase family protein n=1 Tax=Kordiimonas sp. SCSIO 12610 TaxID=2829597 RepID=UPI00210D0392|nr:L,D-transpeptidase family protein [Kordiimonas sp. SCSIO 12610]UTW55452.1 L,D-transpeptidase family protein [Kordiimonas sp. SCSIO 12610]
MTIRWIVQQSANQQSIGRFKGPNFDARCALGREGIATQQDMVEGDFKTPLGVYPIRQIFYRPDKIAVPKTQINVSETSKACGWCDDPNHVDYNRYIRLPFGASHEVLWRGDNIYDLIIVIGHNDDPVIPWKGSAVFIHVARDDYSPTAGCVALNLNDLSQLVELLSPGDEVEILPAQA